MRVLDQAHDSFSAVPVSQFISDFERPLLFDPDQETYIDAFAQSVPVAPAEYRSCYLTRQAD